MTPWETLIPLGASLGFFYMIGFMTKTIIEGRRRRERTKLLADVHAKLIERVGSVKDLSELLSSEGGLKLLDSLGAEAPMRAAGPLDRVGSALQMGTVLSALGVGLLLVALTFGSRIDQDAVAGFGIFGILVLSIGIGFLVSSRASLQLARRFGLLPTEPATAR